jgi:hypothetical protein
MATTDEDFSALSDDEIEARQRAEDGEAADTNPTGEDDAPDAAAADKAAGATEEAKDEPKAEEAKPDAAVDDKSAGATAEKPEGGKPEGVASKDGTRVLPYGALQAARRDARRAETKAESLQRQLDEANQRIADLKSGKAPESEITEEEVARMEEEFPDEGKKMRSLFERAKALEKQIPAAKSATEEAGDDPVQEAIDQVPMLLKWQHEDGEKFARAVEHDAVLMNSPKWKDKPAVERFAEATRRTADEFDIPVDKPKASSSEPAAGDKKPDAKPNPADAAVRKNPETLSDFKGGAVPDHASLDVSRASPQQLLGRMQGMSDAEIDAHLAKYG